MRRSFVAGNWKMHGSRADNERLLAELVHGLHRRELNADRVEIAVAPPLVYLTEVGRTLRDTGVLLSAQNLAAEASGAYTGEVSGATPRDVGSSHVIIGHSERRALYGETDSLVARKVAAAVAAGLTPILCLGESLAERDQGQTLEVVGHQLDAVVGVCGIAALAGGLLAYEPVWAIGTGRTATPEQVQQVHAFLRMRLSSADVNISGSTRIIYGGSVKASNAAELFALPDVDGGLIGGASLKAADFLAIVAAAWQEH